MDAGRVLRSPYRLWPHRGQRCGGGTEIIGYDAASKTYRAHFFDSQGNLSAHELTVQGDTWIWKGEKTGCTAVFTDSGKTQTAHHERLDDRGQWVPAMDVTLI